MARSLVPPLATTAVSTHFVLLQDGPWLYRRVWTPSRRWGFFGLLTLSIVLPLWSLARTTTFVLVLFLYGGTVLALSMFVGVSVALIGDAMVACNRQYCPRCLRYMTRGAHVCPFCHFRPSPHSH